MEHTRDEQLIFSQANGQNMDQSNSIELQNNFSNGVCNGNALHLDMETEHSDGSDQSSSPSQNSESPFPCIPDTPDVDVDNDNTHQLSSMSSDCMDPCSSPLQEGESLNLHETILDMDRRKLQRPNSYTPEQRNLLLKYFDDYKMNSTHRKNMQLIEQCAQELTIPVPKVKNWIGAEAVRRKKKLGLLPKAKMYQPSMHAPQINNIVLTPNKTMKRQRSTPISKPIPQAGYQLVYAASEKQITEANGHDYSKFAMKQYSTADMIKPIPNTVFAKTIPHGVNPAIGQFEMGLEETNVLTPQTVIKQTQRLVNYQLDVDDPQQMLTAIQELYQYLEQQGFEGYGVLVNTKQIQTHLVSTHKGLSYHQSQVRAGKPLENPFMGYIFSENESTDKPATPVTSPDNSVEMNLRRKVEIEFALKYKQCTGKTDIPYDNLSEMDIMIAGMPSNIEFNAPHLYNKYQLEQLAQALPQIFFLRPQDTHEETVIKTEPDSISSYNYIQTVPTALLPNGHIIQPTLLKL
ncbi:hypothetical protein LOD99_8396 [Oopsacas minuta]|uniref:Homeobox domain-containing protein n=1 Tax=Oopsacas minuta TaxID=111878 RepID=A0AAV7JHI2_9METZ|nr:hypothetical protein LOD99_8396 [Oopsacas minuta]